LVNGGIGRNHHAASLGMRAVSGRGQLTGKARGGGHQ
jgi:hypothetical protein